MANPYAAPSHSYQSHQTSASQSQLQSQNQTILPSLSTLSQSLSHLSSSLNHLETCTHDLPRLSRVLSLTPHFALLPSSRLVSAQEKLVSEIEPEILGLLRTVEQVVERREGRGEWLRARWGLYEGRLGRDGSSSASASASGSASGPASGSHSTSSPAAENKSNVNTIVKNGKEELERKIAATRLRQKKERLSYAVERLTLQAQQRERQLRMSVAAQGVRADDFDAESHAADDGAEEGDSGF